MFSGGIERDQWHEMSSRVEFPVGQFQIQNSLQTISTLTNFLYNFR